ncbi:MAG: hypothetical protein U5R49_07765 [Deltaproteobacteria bacterium]|nr:hypothetical protein [Deltaproteobacteria bacterium]
METVQVNIHEAKTQLLRLIREALNGKEVIIASMTWGHPFPQCSAHENEFMVKAGPSQLFIHYARCDTYIAVVRHSDLNMCCKFRR